MKRLIEYERFIFRRGHDSALFSARDQRFRQQILAFEFNWTNPAQESIQTRPMN